ncbi:hypothetical protein DSL72_008477 [Monilinia vaccinii-corymbosi]|uniref:Uncharacterized protein n=1 Tax=Monilinia vaccinii-corymbosi TaxID=61207 RepID=A0A8A3PJP1_9HELO|nr:hypothetical protein DSL72_008477 [Monilinia vaccinii-corymbosi]
MSIISTRTSKSHQLPPLPNKPPVYPQFSLSNKHHVSRYQNQILHGRLPRLCNRRGYRGNTTDATNPQATRSSAADGFRDGKTMENFGTAEGTCEERCSCDFVLVDALHEELVQGDGHEDEDEEVIDSVERTCGAQRFKGNDLSVSTSADSDLGADADINIRTRRSLAPPPDSSSISSEADNGVCIEGHHSHLSVRMFIPDWELRQQGMKLEMVEEDEGEIIGVIDSEILKPMTNLVEEEAGKDTQDETDSRPTTCKAGFSPGTRSAGESPIRQPRGPPPIEELKAKPTALFDGSKNFASRARLTHTGLGNRRAPDTQTKLESGE